MKTIEQYFLVVLFITRCIQVHRLDLAFEPEDEILKCIHSNVSYWVVHTCSAVYYAVQGDSNF